MQYVKSCGGVIYRKHHGNLEILLIKHRATSAWTFPKGHQETGETELQTAEREIAEETGVSVWLDDTFREEITFTPREGIHKTVVYFIGKAKPNQTASETEEVSECRWAEFRIATAILAYENDRAVAAKAHKFLIHTF